MSPGKWNGLLRQFFYFATRLSTSYYDFPVFNLFPMIFGLKYSIYSSTTVQREMLQLIPSEIQSQLQCSLLQKFYFIDGLSPNWKFPLNAQRLQLHLTTTLAHCWNFKISHVGGKFPVKNIFNILANFSCLEKWTSKFPVPWQHWTTIIFVSNANKIVLTFHRSSIAARIICYEHWSSTEWPLFYTTSVHQNILQALRLRPYYDYKHQDNDQV